MHPRRRWALLVILAGCGWPLVAPAQIDPMKRDLIQLGYNAAMEGHAPIAAYAFYYRNDPEFTSTNLALRLAIAPTYVDSELGIRRAVSEHTDLGLGLAGGAFADDYEEIDHGTFFPSESFTGYGAESSVSLYHLFNPSQRIPLNGLARLTGHYSTYQRDSSTASDFQLPKDRGTLSVRSGLRWGGKEPVLFPALAMELSVWYEGRFRTGSGTYGFADRSVEPQSHLFWSQALLAYTLPELKHSFYMSVTAGTSLEADRFSAYRLGSLLPLVSEFPLSLPGYYYQEISARQFVLMGGNYTLPLDAKQRWNLNATASTAVVDYLPGTGQPGNWNTGVGGGLLYKSPTWKVMIGYGYGVNAIRTHGRGAQSVGILLQLDLGQARESLLNPEEPNRWRGLQEILNVLGK